MFVSGRLSSLLKYLWARPGAYPRVDLLNGVRIGKLWPYSQTLYWAGMACQEQNLQITKNDLKRDLFYKLFTTVTTAAIS